MVIYFGKHKGKDVRDVPQSYLWWLYDQPWFTKFDGPLKAEIEDVLGIQRARKPSQKCEHIFAEIVKTGYRELVKKHHPDVGGNTQRMADINEAYDILRELLNIGR